MVGIGLFLMPAVASARLSFDPLLKASGCADAFTVQMFGHSRQPPHGCQRDSPYSTLAELLGTTYRNVLRWRRDGIPIKTAEEAAFALGDHPFNIWGDEWLYACLCPVAKLTAKSAS